MPRACARKEGRERKEVPPAMEGRASARGRPSRLPRRGSLRSWRPCKAAREEGRGRLEPCQSAEGSREGTSRDSAAVEMAQNDPQSARELLEFAENLLQQVHENFQALTDKLTLRMEDMGEQIDDLEKHVNGLVAQAGVENASEELTH
ncbi:heat shock factor-binding protein 1-like protein 1 [Sphaerodactylus townsendi]|uniref:heat shock factor-binding protein 1-like protein 1 n=1 Tax=Sphaerodactylus townsendi TaxID=933632 RepID=UPI0020274577|nr:heat shock factor-binding protein 1-like protein 1 [Sphaerodactylus townsendi]